MKKAQTGKRETRTLREEWAILWRGIRIWNEIIPGCWIYPLICELLDTFSPYFGLYMSAQLVNELAGNCEFVTLLRLAALTAGGEFAISLGKRIFEGRRDMQDARIWNLHEAYMIDAQNQFQYEHLENPDVVLKRSEIFACLNAFGGGLGAVRWTIPRLLRNLLSVLLSAVLTISMFTLSAKRDDTGFWGFLNSPVSAVVILLLILLNAAGTIKISAARTNRSQAAVGDLANLNTRLEACEFLFGSDMIAFDLNRIVMDDFKKHNLHPEWIRKSQKVHIRYDSLSVILNAALNLAVFLFTAAKAFIGAFGIGSLILYQGTVQRFIQGVSGLAGNIGSLRNNNQYLIQLYEYLDLPNRMYNGTLAVEKRDDIDYEIEFCDVSFRYPRTDTWALRHVNLKFKIGNKLAIVGENGSGKTTLIKLLCRLYDPTEGRILLNGIDITRYRYDEYMALFSVVFQDYTLFGFSIGENVSALRPYDEAKVRDCLIRAGMGEKLADLDADADTKGKSALERAIGRDYENDGADLSGGECQKIALARALYKDAPFVILDEPTAALDPIAEAAVYENFNQIVKDKTSVFISHRLSSCRFCDTIAVFERGRIVQEGPHDVLIADADGTYSLLWNAQAQYYRK